ncbi:MAG: short chain dehydrogenase [Legionellales bacterium]|nr:short chain dehydrogenase [Legionellales bacterium]
MSTLKGRTVIITGASRGIGLAIAERFAKEGANIVVAAKTSEPHPKLPGTIHSAAEVVESYGVKALPLAVDVRNEEAIAEMVDTTMSTFGRIDALINNASAISLTSTLDTEMKRYDLMHSVNVRATFACSKACIPYLKDSDLAHILTMSPPLVMDPKWFQAHLAYTMSKYGMSMCTLGLAQEMKGMGISVNSLWPKTTIATAAIANNFPPELMKASRKPEIVADAALAILTRSSKPTGQFFIDETVLRESGVTSFDHYAESPNVPLMTDLFLPDE